MCVYGSWGMDGMEWNGGCGLASGLQWQEKGICHSYSVGISKLIREWCFSFFSGPPAMPASSTSSAQRNTKSHPNFAIFLRFVATFLSTCSLFWKMMGESLEPPDQ